MKKFEYYPSDMQKKYDVVFTNEIKSIKSSLKELLNVYKSPIYIVDSALPDEYIKIVEKMTGKHPNGIIRIKAGKKTLTKLATIWSAMVQALPDAAIVIGGGAICDLAGVACANYQRGIPRILFPTTVLAQVDASIGGKTGIDFAHVKNSVGAMHYPVVTVNYLPFLKSLPKKEFISGFSEIVKAGVLYDKNFFNVLYRAAEDGLDKDSDKIEDILFGSSSIKARICEEKEGGKIRLLYGHAIGHAIESAEGLHLRHGDCVAIGMHLEGAIACMMNIWNLKEWQRQLKLMNNLGLPIDLPSKVTVEQITKKMLLYKKLVNQENYLFVLPDKIGSVYHKDTNCLTAIPKKSMKGIIEKALKWSKLNSNV